MENQMNAAESTLRAVAEAMRIPVLVILIALMAVSLLLLLGWLIYEAIAERRKLKAELCGLIEKLRAGEETPKRSIGASGLLIRQKRALITVLAHPEFDPTMREALAARLITEERTRYKRIIAISDMIVRLGPVFGLLGTLIPLGPGVIALAQGDTFTLSSSLLTAFDTTVAGLLCAALCAVISAVRRGWYDNYMSILETLMECVCDLEEHGHEQIQ